MDTEPVRVFAPGGHVTWITQEWAPLHQRFHMDAYSKGCISDDMVKNPSAENIDPSVVNVLNNVALQRNEIETAMRKVIAKKNPNDFQEKDGKPKATTITSIVGFRVSAAQRDAAWHKIKETENASA